MNISYFVLDYAEICYCNKTWDLYPNDDDACLQQVGGMFRDKAIDIHISNSSIDPMQAKEVLWDSP